MCINIYIDLYVLFDVMKIKKIFFFFDFISYRYLCINNGPGNQPYVWKYDIAGANLFNQDQSFISRSNT